MVFSLFWLQKEERGRGRGNSKDWDLTFGWVGHPEISSELLDGRHPGRDGHFFCDRGEGVMQTPGIPGPEFVYKWLEVEIGCIRQQANRQDPLHEDVMDDRFGFGSARVRSFRLLISRVSLPK